MTGDNIETSHHPADGLVQQRDVGAVPEDGENGREHALSYGYIYGSDATTSWTRSGPKHYGIGIP
jgi:hypothetical protein